MYNKNIVVRMFPVMNPSATKLSVQCVVYMRDVFNLIAVSFDQVQSSEYGK